MIIKSARKEALLRNKKLFFTILIVVLVANVTNSQNKFVTLKPQKNSFPLVTDFQIANLVVDTADYEGVHIAVKNLQKDIYKVTSKEPLITSIHSGNKSVIIGTLGHSKSIDSLVKIEKLDPSPISGKWEAFTIQNIDGNLVIAGSDKRGTIYAVYHLSEEIGVSPWYWWADVPVKKAAALYINPINYINPGPQVHYRGIFINDEAPALAGWAQEKFGGFNHTFYEHVFELILRLKGNYLWPAMWGRAFYDDDPKNPILADKYGIVIGTSHHEPLMRAHAEWDKYGEGTWNFDTNSENLKNFWRKGMERMGSNESLITVGMRGDGDEPMTEGTAIELLENIVNEQRKIIAAVTNKPAEQTPQVWALYKEVQDYYDQGMRVPDDVTLLLADDNWGNIRKLPPLKEEKRSGGYGIYYHFDYVGGPRNYKWLNTSQISRVYEQMSLAYAYNARKIWIVNVGDIKPMEFPTSFFLDYAWNPENFTVKDLKSYPARWAKQQFGEEYALEISELIQAYSTLASRRKPELTDEKTYSLNHFNEAQNILDLYSDLELKAINIQQKLPEIYQNAYYQLVLFPIEATANLNRLYIASAKNKMYAKQGRKSTSEFGKQVEYYFKKDHKLTQNYHSINDSKWNHMMSQTHIGYTYWQQPDKNKMPPVETVEIPEKGSLGIATAGTDFFYPSNQTLTILPFDDYHTEQTFTLFNRGKNAFRFNLHKIPDWLSVSKKKGKVIDEEIITVRLKEGELPANQEKANLKVFQENSVADLEISYNPYLFKPSGHLEYNGIVSIASTSFIKNEGWEILPDLGRKNNALRPLKKFKKDITKENTILAYEFSIKTDFKGNLIFNVSPTLDFLDQNGLTFSYQIDQNLPKILNILKDTPDNWDTSVSNNVTRVVDKVQLKPGIHKLIITGIDPGIVIQHILFQDDSNIQKSYMTPPESIFIKK